jgi:phytol kinase
MLNSVREFLIQVLPDFKTSLFLSPAFLVYIAAAAGLAGHLRLRKNVATAYTRKVFHFFIFTAAGVIHLLSGLPEVVLFGSLVCLCVLYALLRGDGHPFYEAMARPQDSPHRSFFILVPMLTTLAGGVLANLLFGRWALVGYFVCGWGDAVGEPAGARWGRHRYRVPSLLRVPAYRSREGSAAVFMAGTLVAFLVLWAGGRPFPTSLGAGLACGCIGALVEAISTHGLDNLTIQVAAAGMAYLLLS